MRRRFTCLLYGEQTVARQICFLCPKEPAVGVLDERCGETLQAFVPLKEGGGVTQEELSSYCTEQTADYKYPRTIEFLDELPNTAAGKFLRRELR